MHTPILAAADLIRALMVSFDGGPDPFGPTILLNRSGQHLDVFCERFEGVPREDRCEIISEAFANARPDDVNHLTFAPSEYAHIP